MTKFTSPQFSSLLERLFQETTAISPDSSIFLSQLSEAERQRLMRSKTEYLALYSGLKHLPLAVSRETGLLLYMLARASKARSIVEFGTSFGVSTLHLAAALRDNGGGLLITTEFEPSKVARARANLEEADLIDLVEIREGDALQTLAQDMPDTIDLLLLDGAKALYPDILNLLESRLRPGALIIADNSGYSPEYLAKVRSAANGYLSLPQPEDVELSLRLF
jgi:predicted O-methyltransferase YrrM